MHLKLVEYRLMIAKSDILKKIPTSAGKLATALVQTCMKSNFLF